MLLNWHTIDACFLSSAFRIRSSWAFFGTCFFAFSLVLVLEFLRRGQRQFDRYLRSKATAQPQGYCVPEDIEEKLLVNGGAESVVPVDWSRKVDLMMMMLEQFARGVIHTVQFGVSYCIMLMFMYSNGTNSPHLLVSS